MGLDSYIYSSPKSIIPDTEFFDGHELSNYWEYTTEHIYLRKDWDFHEFMFDLYKEKGGTLTNNEFNGICVVLNEKDIALIEEKYRDSELWDIMFYGLKYVKDKVKDDKLAIYYDSSW